MSQSRGESAADFDLHGSVSAPLRCNTCLTFKKVGRHESLKVLKHFEIRVASVCFFLT